MKLLKKISVYILAIAFVLGGSACEKGFEEMNTDPFNPTETSVNFLFNSVIASLRYVGNEELYLNGQKVYQWSQLAAATWDEPNEINDLGRPAVWYTLYDALRDIREIYKRLDEYPGDPERMINRRAMLDILFAYKSLRVTDVYGDIPYSEAGQGINADKQVFRPKYDTQESIYRDALSRLKSAVDNMVTDPSATTPAGETYFNYGVNETLFGNDMVKWKRLANALRLRYALRMSNVDESGAREIISDVLSGGLDNLPQGHEDMLAFGNDWNSIGAGMYWSFQYHFNVRLGENAWNHLTEDPNPDGSGIIDPRTYVWYETNINNEWVPAPQNPIEQTERGGEPYNDLRRNDTDGFDLRGNYSAFNWYMVENDDSGLEFHVTYPEVCYMLAEIYHRGWGSGDAQEWYEKGLRASVEKWYTYGGTTNPDWANPPAMPDDTTIDAFINHPQIAYNATDGLKLIHTQRWLEYMLQPQEAWFLTRRSGLIPVLKVQNAVSGQETPMPRRLRYPEDERNNNLEMYNAQVATMNGGDDLMTRPWWDVK